MCRGIIITILCTVTICVYFVHALVFVRNLCIYQHTTVLLTSCHCCTSATHHLFLCVYILRKYVTCTINMESIIIERNNKHNAKTVVKKLVHCQRTSAGWGVWSDKGRGCVCSHGVRGEGGIGGERRTHERCLATDTGSHGVHHPPHVHPRLLVLRREEKEKRRDWIICQALIIHMYACRACCKKIESKILRAAKNYVWWKKFNT